MDRHVTTLAPCSTPVRYRDKGSENRKTTPVLVAVRGVLETPSRGGS